MGDGLRIGIIGGSIGGTCAAVLLARQGHHVEVFERTLTRLEDRGAALGCEIAAVQRWKALDLLDDGIEGVRPDDRVWCVKDGDLPLGRQLYVQPMVIEQLSWGFVFEQLRRRLPSGNYNAGTEVVTVVQSDHDVAITLSNGETRRFDLLIAADGYQSRIRAQFFPGAVRRFAGYVGWRGILAERDVEDMEPVLRSMQSVGTPRGIGLFLMMPGPGGNMTPGQRGVTWLWYEAMTQVELFGAKRAADGTIDAEIPAIPPGQMNAEIRAHLDAMADDVLPPWHARLVHLAPDPFMQPIYDVTLDDYTNGRICLLGDASTTARPHTGSGAAKAIGDAIHLSEVLAETSDVVTALQDYGTARAEFGNGIVELGRSVGQSLVLGAPEWHTMSPDDMHEWATKATTSVYFHRIPSGSDAR
jgi:2-polyprenyl-6-methoxyphenol hydroxylase-like FAD-dependent oxidoreductase